jgi:hypothetical protein
MACRTLKLAAPLLTVALFALPISAADIRIPIPEVEIHVAHSHPPRVRHEVIPARPGDDYVWVNGSWGWQENNWVWIPGRWDRPAEVGVTWVHPRYVHEYGSYRYEPGHWSNQQIREGEDYRSWKERHHHYESDRDRDRDER